MALRPHWLSGRCKSCNERRAEHAEPLDTVVLLRSASTHTQAHESGSIRLKGLSGATAAPAPQYGSGGPYGGSGRTASSGFGAAGPRVARGPGGSGTDVGTGIVQQGGGVGYGGGGEVGQAREELLPRATLGAGGRLEAGAVAGGQLPAAGAEGLQHRPVGGLGSGAVQGGGQGSARELRGAQEERGGDKSKKE